MAKDLREAYVDDVVAWKAKIAMAKPKTAAVVAFDQGAKKDTLKVRKVSSSVQHKLRALNHKNLLGSSSNNLNFIFKVQTSEDEVLEQFSSRRRRASSVHHSPVSSKGSSRGSSTHRGTDQDHLKEQLSLLCVSGPSSRASIAEHQVLILVQPVLKEVVEEPVVIVYIKLVVLVPLLPKSHTLVIILDLVQEEDQEIQLQSMEAVEEVITGGTTPPNKKGKTVFI
jgi:hypothetical protein